MVGYPTRPVKCPQSLAKCELGWFSGLVAVELVGFALHLGVEGLAKQQDSPVSSGAGENMWYLLEDFFEQSLVMQALIGWGWLSIVIMVTSLADTVIANLG